MGLYTYGCFFEVIGVPRIHLFVFHVPASSLGISRWKPVRELEHHHQFGKPTIHHPLSIAMLEPRGMIALFEKKIAGHGYPPKIW